MTSRPVRICFCLKGARSWSEFRINFNQCSMRSFQRALVRFNKLWIHFIFIWFVCVSKKPSLPLQMESWVQCLGGCIFSYCRGNFIFFFHFPFWYFKFGVCITAWKRVFGFWLYFYLSKGVSLCSRNRFFAISSIILSHFQLSRIDLPILTSIILIEIVTILVVLVDEFYFWMHHPIKAWIFDFIFAFS